MAPTWDSSKEKERKEKKSSEEKIRLKTNTLSLIHSRSAFISYLLDLHLEHFQNNFIILDGGTSQVPVDVT